MNIIDRKDNVSIIGAGLSGIACALYLHEKGIKCSIYTKSIQKGSSYMAQGGIACPMNQEDSYFSHILDTLNAGNGYCSIRTVYQYIRECFPCIEDMIRWGCSFDYDESGIFSLHKEGGHTHSRILHNKGDQTGKHIIDTLLQLIYTKNNISIYQDHTITEISRTSSIQGFFCRHKEEEYFIMSKYVVLATGGIGGLYYHSTNPNQYGLGGVLAYTVGAHLHNLSSVQFHPTCFIDNDRVYLITEALRGINGVTIVNSNNHEFLTKYHDNGPLAPRDVVTNSILQEQKVSSPIYIKIESSLLQRICSDFPSFSYLVTNKHKKDDVNIPIQPAQHYHMGGVLTNSYGMTGIDGLWCIGECACSGFHGDNRLASNSLLECIVMSKRASLSISGMIPSYKERKTNVKKKHNKYLHYQEYDKKCIDIVRHKMSQYYIGFQYPVVSKKKVYTFLCWLKEQYRNQTPLSCPKIFYALLITQSYYDKINNIKGRKDYAQHKYAIFNSPKSAS